MRLVAASSDALHGFVSSVLIFSKSSDSDEVLLAVINDLLPMFSPDSNVVRFDSVSSDSALASFRS